MSLEDRIKRLERTLQGKTEEIRLEDGTTVRLPDGTTLQAFVAVLTNAQAMVNGGEPLERVPYEDIFRQAVPPNPMDLIGFVRGMIEQADQGSPDLEDDENE